MLSDDTIIELHSEDCVCHGHRWRARRKGSQCRSECCATSRGLRPDGAVWVDADIWLALGLPRTAEQYYQARLDKRTLGGGSSQ